MPIFDQGYQHWRGPLSGHAWRWLTIARQGTRVQTKGRGLRACVLMAWLPALGLVLFMALWGLLEKKTEGLIAILKNILPADFLADPRAYRTPVWTLAFSYFFQIEMFFIMLLVAVAGPGLISGDLRFNALPLYFARPLNRLDYFLGKLGVIGSLVASVAVLPAVFAYFIGLCFSLDLSVIRDTWTILLASIGFGLIVTVSAGTLILAMSSLTRRSLYVGIAWAGMWIISYSVAASLTGIHRDAMRRESYADEASIYVDEMAKWIEANPPPAGVEPPQGPPVPRMRVRPGRRRFGAEPLPFMPKPDHHPWLDAWSQASQQAWAKAHERRNAELRGDWRPLFSYVGNLQRIADRMLDTDAAWVTIGRAVVRAESAAPGMGGFASTDERNLADQMVPQYPWQWSAGVLVGLLGLSSWTLTRRVKSLDRLK